VKAVIASHYERSLQQDLEELRQKVLEMARLDELALQQAIEALYKNNSQLAYMVILRDQMIDELEIELDRLCIRFITRHQPVAGHLRFVYSVIKIIGELERVGDYAESIARHVIHLTPLKIQVNYDSIKKLADVSTTMFRKAVDAFIRKDVEQSTCLMEMEEEADKLRNKIAANLFKLRQDGTLPLEALNPLLTIARRLERVTDQSRNFCEETLYITTGEVMKHKGADLFHVLFLDEDNSSISQMAEAIGKALKMPRFIFSSAGLTAEPIRPEIKKFLSGKNLDLTNFNTKSFEVLSHHHEFHVIITLGLKRSRAKSLNLKKWFVLDWPIKLSKPAKSTEQTAEFEQIYNYLSEQIYHFAQAVLGRDQQAVKA
jgi:phosphate transport system protein